MGRGRSGCCPVGNNGSGSAPTAPPEVMEFAAAELAALSGMSSATGGAADRRRAEPAAPPPPGVGRDRHQIGTGTVPIWLLARVARRCAAVGLGLEQARWVDAQTTPYAATLPPHRFLKLVEAKIIAADPAAAEARANQAALERFVRTGQTDELGLKTPSRRPVSSVRAVSP
ncbi:MAG TPA: hypothetical protein VFG72_01810 [Marmoricola sp.]|nr:hypothetical protein [Marmoricola sp.]